MYNSSKVNRFFLAEADLEGQKANDRLTRHMKKKGKLDFGNPNDIWKYAYQRNMTKLAIFVLLYTFSNDDGEISDKEFSQIKKFYKKERENLTIEDQKEIYALALKKMTLRDFLDYMEKNDFEKSILEEAVHKISKMLRKESRYTNILKELIEL